MPSRIEDYAVIADYQSVALVAKDGSLDWLCLPRFDSDACFAALLGTNDNGRWKIAPEGEVRAVRRRYRPGTLILETELETAEGAVTLIDLMPIFGQGTDVVRIVAGNRGRVPMRMELLIRFGYGAIVPWVRAIEGGIEAVAGPDALRLITPVVTHGGGWARSSGSRSAPENACRSCSPGRRLTSPTRATSMPSKHSPGPRPTGEHGRTSARGPVPTGK